MEKSFEKLSNNNDNETNLNNIQFNKKDNMLEQEEDFIDQLKENEIEDYTGSRNIKKDPEEYKHLKDICAAFFNYKIDSIRDVVRMERDFKSIPEAHKKRLKFDYKDRIKSIMEAIDINFLFLTKVVSPYSNMFKFFLNDKKEILIEPLRVFPKNIIKMRSTLKLFIRDWSEDGKEERDSCYKPIIDELNRIFPSNKDKNGEIRSILLPGVGLGRLLYECTKLGFNAQGNEFSYFMLLCSNFMLNCTNEKEEFTIQPLIHSFSNIFWKDAPFKKIKIPDENLLENLSLNPQGQMSMVAGEFVEIYSKQEEKWDSVITSFFIDTANNIIAYVETIYKILKSEGVWINFGPLLYHYSEIESECSIELSWEELKLIILDFGFDIVKEEIKECVYSSEHESMMKSVYRCIFFTAIKK